MVSVPFHVSFLENPGSEGQTHQSVEEYNFCRKKLTAVLPFENLVALLTCDRWQVSVRDTNLHLIGRLDCSYVTDVHEDESSEPKMANYFWHSNKVNFAIGFHQMITKHKIWSGMWKSVYTTKNWFYSVSNKKLNLLFLCIYLFTQSIFLFKKQQQQHNLNIRLIHF